MKGTRKTRCVACGKLAVSALLALHLAVTFAQAEPVVVQNLTGDLSVVTLNGAGTPTQGTTTLTTYSSPGREYNALGFRGDGTPGADNWLYAVELDATSTTNIPNTNSGIIGIDPVTGAITVVDLTPEYTTDGGTTTANMTTRIAAGDFNGDIMYIVEDDKDYGINDGRYLYSTDFAAAGVTKGSAAELVFDRVAITGGDGDNTQLAVFDYDYWDGYLWGVSRLGRLSKLALDGTRTDFNIGLPPSFNQFGGYGAVWVDDTIPGSLFAYINKVNADNGAIYRIDGIASTSTAAADFSIVASWLAPNISWNDGTYLPEPIPEPATMFLLGTGLVGVAGAARRKKKNQA